MSANEERLYRRYRSQRKEARTELSGYQDTNQRLQHQVDRLNQVKRIVTEQKFNFRPIWGAVSKIIDDSYGWKGNNYDNFQSNGSYLKSDNNRYYNSIDDVLDAINDEITRLENQIYENEGLIGKLKSWINTLTNRMENLFN